MDRHGAYVALSRHRESVSVHWGRDDVGDRGGLVKRLSRERLKDTTLDYPQVRDRDAGFAQRRGLFVPESEIVVGRGKAASGPQKDRQSEAVRTPEPAPAQQKRGIFDGLDLSVRPGRRTAEKDVSAGMEAEAGKGENGVKREAPVSPFAGLRLPRVQREQVPVGLGGFVPGSDPLQQAVERYARAWVDAERMVRQELPVLEHQKKTLFEAGRDLERVRRGGEADLRAARFVRTWDGLSREQQGVALKELKRDAQLESILREKSRELGIRKGSTLDHGLHPHQREQSLSWFRSRGMDIEM
nr:hypothetical protein [Gluconobacter kondonii]